MKNTKVFYALQHLTSREKGRLRDYVRSPFFNKDGRLAALLNTLIDEEKAVAGGKLDSRDIWRRVRGRDAYNDQRMRKYASDLLRLIIGFMYQTASREDKGAEYLVALDALHVRRMDRLYSSVVKASRKESDSTVYRTGSYFHRKYSIERRFYEVSDSEFVRGSASSTPEILDALDTFFVIEKLRLFCSVKGRRFYLPDDDDIRFMKTILDELPRTSLLETPTVNIYWRLARTYTDFDAEDNVRELRNLIAKHIHQFPADDQDEIYRGLINYYVRRANQGHSESLPQIVEVYTEILEAGILNSQGELSPWQFKNAVLAGLRTSKYAWVLNMLETHAERLPDDYRRNALDFNYAQVHFYRKEYDKVLERLQAVEYQDPAYALNSRNLLIAVYYELGQLGPLGSAIDSFRAYLKRRQGLSDSLRQAYRNLLNATLRLSKATKRDTRAHEKIEQYLLDHPHTASLQWLSDKLAELREGRRNW